MIEVTSSIITVVGMLLSLFFSQYLNYKQRKDDKKERIFYELYPKRINLYEDVCNTLIGIKKNGEILTKISPDKAYEQVINDLNKLSNLASRLDICGSIDTSQIINNLFEKVTSLHHKYFGLNPDSSNILSDKDWSKTISKFTIDYDNSIKSGCITFTKIAKTEARADFLDKEISGFLDKTSNKNKP